MAAAPPAAAAAAPAAATAPAAAAGSAAALLRGQATTAALRVDAGAAERKLWLMRVPGYVADRWALACHRAMHSTAPIDVDEDDIDLEDEDEEDEGMEMEGAGAAGGARRPVAASAAANGGGGKRARAPPAVLGRITMVPRADGSTEVTLDLGSLATDPVVGVAVEVGGGNGGGAAGAGAAGAAAAGGAGGAGSASGSAAAPAAAPGSVVPRRYRMQLCEDAPSMSVLSYEQPAPGSEAEDAAAPPASAGVFARAKRARVEGAVLHKYDLVPAASASASALGAGAGAAAVAGAGCVVRPRVPLPPAAPHQQQRQQAAAAAAAAGGAGGAAAPRAPQAASAPAGPPAADAVALDPRYRLMNRARTAASVQRGRTVELIEDAGQARALLASTSIAEEPLWSRQRKAQMHAARFGLARRQAVHAANAVRADKDELEARLFALFERQGLWHAHALQRETGQPMGWLKEVLAEVATQHKRGPNKDLWEIKREFRAAAAAGAAEAAAAAAAAAEAAEAAEAAAAAAATDGGGGEGGAAGGAPPNDE